MAANGLERIIAPRKHRMRMHGRNAVQFCDIPVHARNLERTLLLAKNVLPALQVVVADLDVHDGAYSLELRPMFFVFFTKSRQGRNELLARLEDQKESIVYLHRLHRGSIPHEIGRCSLSHGVYQTELAAL